MTADEEYVRSVVRRLLATGDMTRTARGGPVGAIRPLTGGRNNRLYACRVGDQEICVKRYVRDSARRAKHEWAALTILSALGIDIAPQPLYYAPSPDPTLVMSLLAGSSLGEASLSTAQIKQIAGIFDTLHSIGAGRLADRLPVVRMPVRRMLQEVCERWRVYLADDSSPLRKELFTRWRQWVGGPDIAVLDHVSAPVFGQGDPNTSNYLWDGSRVRVVDFEYAGWSNRYHELALLVEHVQSRATSDGHWLLLEDLLCVTEEDRVRTRAARALVAWYWTLEFWPGQAPDSERFTWQAERLLHVLSV